MGAKVLTAMAVQAAKPRPKRYEIPDGGALGLYLVIQPSGVKSWARRYRFNGRTAKQTLGSAVDITLAQARARAAEIGRLIERGIDPTPRQRDALPPVVEDDSVEALAALFIERHAKKRRTWRQIEDALRRLVLPVWRGRRVQEIRRRHIIELVEQIATDRPYLANRTLGVLSKFFNWLVARDIIEISPAIGIDRPGQEVSRERVLSDDEVRRLWTAASDPAEGAFGPFFKLLVLTGQRRSEVSGMRWSEIDADARVWRLPPTRTKNAKPHQVPLVPQAWDLIQAQPRFVGSDFVLSMDGKRPIIGYARAKRRLSAKAGIEADCWRYHDLRRTTASGLQRLGVRTEVIERCLNHVSGSFRGIAGVYQRDPLIDEVRAALQAWADRVEQIVVGTPAKVISLRGKRPWRP
jgi:integrase